MTSKLQASEYLFISVPIYFLYVQRYLLIHYILLFKCLNGINTVVFRYVHTKETEELLTGELTESRRNNWELLECKLMSCYSRLITLL